MPRPRKYQKPRLVSLVLESDIYDEMMKTKPRSAGLGDYLSQLFLENREKAELLSEIMALRKENEALKKELADLREKLEKLGASPATKKAAEDGRWERVRALLRERGEMKVIEVLKALGHTEMGEALQRRAREFVNEAIGHGIAVAPEEGVGVLGWKVRLSPSSEV